MLLAPLLDNINRMPAPTPGTTNGVETFKKRSAGVNPKTTQKRRRVDRNSAHDSASELGIQDEILGLEEKILESQSNYNSIQTLLNFLRVSSVPDDNRDVLAAVALCRVFCRLMVAKIEQVATKFRYRDYHCAMAERTFERIRK